MHYNIAYRTPNESYFPNFDLDLCEAIRYASLWLSKDPSLMVKNTLFWVMFEMDLCSVVNQKPWLSLVSLNQYHGIANFKEDFHNIYLQAKKDVESIWYELPYLVTNKDNSLSNI